MMCVIIMIHLIQAYHNARFYPNYAWILLGHHDTDWWREYYMNTNCTDADMMMVLNRSLILTPYPDIGLEDNKVCTTCSCMNAANVVLLSLSYRYVSMFL